MNHFEAECKKRIEIGNRYSTLLADADVITPKVMEDRNSMYAQYSIRVKNREVMIQKLSDASVPTAVHYPIPLHLQEALGYLGYKKGDFPLSEQVGTEIMSLPMSPFLTTEQQDFVVNAIKA